MSIYTNISYCWQCNNLHGKGTKLCTLCEQDHWNKEQTPTHTIILPKESDA